MLRQEVRQMKQKDYYIYLDEQEYSQVIQSLIALKNDLIAQGRYGSRSNHATLFDTFHKLKHYFIFPHLKRVVGEIVDFLQAEYP